MQIGPSRPNCFATLRFCSFRRGVELSEESGFLLSPKRTVQIANPATSSARKILIQEQRDLQGQSKGFALDMHDTVEVFSENLEELRRIFRKDIVPQLHSRRCGRTGTSG